MAALRDTLHTAKVVGTFITGRIAVGAGVGSAIAFKKLSYVGAPFFALPLGATVMSYISQMNKHHADTSLLLFYKDQVAAKLGKNPALVTLEDLETVGRGDPEKGIEGNPVIDEELRRHRMTRNISIVVHGLAALATMTLLGSVVLTGLAPAIAATVLGLGAMTSCMAIDLTLDAVSSRVFKLKEPTAHDRIEEITANRSLTRRNITPEQVLGVFMAANPALAMTFQNAHKVGYHDPSITPEIRTKTVQLLDHKLQLTQLTQDINRGVISLSELAFAACGQRSGVPPRQPARPIAERVRSGLGQSLNTGRQKVAEWAAHGRKQLHDTWQQCFAKVDQVEGVVPDHQHQLHAVTAPATARSETLPPASRSSFAAKFAESTASDRIPVYGSGISPTR